MIESCTKIDLGDSRYIVINNDGSAELCQYTPDDALFKAIKLKPHAVTNLKQGLVDHFEPGDME